MNRTVTFAFGLCFTLALGLIARGQQISGGGGATLGANIFTGAQTLPAGTSAAPSLTFNTLAGGFYVDPNVPNSLAFAKGIPVLQLAQGEFGLVGNGIICWGNQTNTFASSSDDTCIKRNAAGVIEINNSGGGTFRELKLRSLVIGGTAPALTGTCTTGSQTGGATAGTFTATCTAQTVILTFGFTAPTGWSCNTHDQSTPADTLNQTATSTTTATLTGTTVASDVINFNCMAY